MSEGAWSVVGYAGHPVDGDPAEVREAASAFVRTGRRLEQAAVSLRAAHSNTLLADAFEALDDNIREVAATLDLVVHRYEEAGSALSTYGPVLEKAKRQAEEALAAATTAHGDHSDASGRANDLYWAATTTLDPEQRQQFVHWMRVAEREAETASAAYAEARQRIEEAIATRDSAATTAADRIDMAVSDSALNDTLLDKARHVAKATLEYGDELLRTFPVLREAVEQLKKVGAFLWEHSGEISFVLGIAAVAANLIPIPGLAQALSAACLVGAKVFGAMAVLRSGLAVGRAVQRGDKEAAFKGGLTMLLSFGAGKLLRGLGKANMQGAARRSATVGSNRGYRHATDVFTSMRRQDAVAKPIDKFQNYFRGDATSRATDQLLREELARGGAGAAAENALRQGVRVGAQTGVGRMIVGREVVSPATDMAADASWDALKQLNQAGQGCWTAPQPAVGAGR